MKVSAEDFSVHVMQNLWLTRVKAKKDPPYYLDKQEGDELLTMLGAMGQIMVAPVVQVILKPLWTAPGQGVPETDGLVLTQEDAIEWCCVGTGIPLSRIRLIKIEERPFLIQTLTMIATGTENPLRRTSVKPAHFTLQTLEEFWGSTPSILEPVIAIYPEMRRAFWKSLNGHRVPSHFRPTLKLRIPFTRSRHVLSTGGELILWADGIRGGYDFPLGKDSEFYLDFFEQRAARLLDAAE